MSGRFLLPEKELVVGNPQLFIKVNAISLNCKSENSSKVALSSVS